jgi:hypothetical protein
MRSMRSAQLAADHFPSSGNTARRLYTLVLTEPPYSSSPETHRAWSICDAVQNLGLLPLLESAVSLVIAALVLISPNDVLLPQSVYLFSIASDHVQTEAPARLRVDRRFINAPRL